MTEWQLVIHIDAFAARYRDCNFITEDYKMAPSFNHRQITMSSGLKWQYQPYYTPDNNFEFLKLFITISYISAIVIEDTAVARLTLATSIF